MCGQAIIGEGITQVKKGTENVRRMMPMKGDRINEIKINCCDGDSVTEEIGVLTQSRAFEFTIWDAMQLWVMTWSSWQL